MSMFAAFVAGALFALGLSLSGMTEPARVIGFLDITGEWDPSLAFVMGGAVTVYAVLYQVIVRRLAQPLVADEFHVPQRAPIDAKLVFGAALFGVGWGLAGFCPGPAVVALGAGKVEAALFVLALIAGSWVASVLPRIGRAATGAREQPGPELASDDF